MELKEMFTDDTNATLQPAYVLGAIAFLLGIGLEIYSVVSGHPFDLQAYGIGMGVLIGAVEGGKRLGS